MFYRQVEHLTAFTYCFSTQVGRELLLYITPYSLIILLT